MKSYSEKVQAAVKEMDPKHYVDTLVEEMRDKARLLLLFFAYNGYGLVFVTYGRRSLKEQQEIYGAGRNRAQCTAVGVPAEYARPDEPMRTWCLPEESKHVKGRALDVTYRQYELIPHEVCRRGAALVGLDWGGDWRKKDYGHFEL